MGAGCRMLMHLLSGGPCNFQQNKTCSANNPCFGVFRCSNPCTRWPNFPNDSFLDEKKPLQVEPSHRCCSLQQSPKHGSKMPKFREEVSHSSGSLIPNLEEFIHFGWLWLHIFFKVCHLSLQQTVIVTHFIHMYRDLNLSGWVWSQSSHRTWYLQLFQSGLETYKNKENLFTAKLSERNQQSLNFSEPFYWPGRIRSGPAVLLSADQTLTTKSRNFAPMKFIDLHGKGGPSNETLPHFWCSIVGRCVFARMDKVRRGTRLLQPKEPKSNAFTK